MQLICTGEERVRMTERERINAVINARFYRDTHLAAGYDFRLPKMDLYLPRGLSGRSKAMNVLYDYYWLERRRIKYALDDCVLSWYSERAEKKYRYAVPEYDINSARHPNYSIRWKTIGEKFIEGIMRI